MNISDVMAFDTRLTTLNIETPAPIRRGLELLKVASQHVNTRPEGGLLDMTDDEARDRVAELAIRRHEGGGAISVNGKLTPAKRFRGLSGGLEVFQLELLAEIQHETLPHLDGIIEQLQPRFDELAAGLIEGTQVYGFTSDTTSDEVIDRADDAASAAWRAMRRSWLAIQPIAELRIDISRTFNLSPTSAEVLADIGSETTGRPNWSVCFAAGDNWSLDTGYLTEGKRGSHLDWISLAAGGLHLNTPTETRRKITAREHARYAAA